MSGGCMDALVRRMRWLRGMLAGAGLRRGGMAAALLLPVLLQGCFHADRFTLEIAIEEAGQIDLSFTGDLIYLPALITGQSGPAETERGLAAAMARIAADPATRRLVRDGDRLRLDYRLRIFLEPGRSFAFPPVGPPVLTITADGAGGLTLRGLALPFEVQRAAERSGLGFAGTIHIEVNDGYTVVEAGGDGDGAGARAFDWSITSFRDPVPFLRLEPER